MGAKKLRVLIGILVCGLGLIFLGLVLNFKFKWISKEELSPALKKVGAIFQKSEKTKIEKGIPEPKPEETKAPEVKIAKELIKYEMKVIREFEWNAGIDSIHKFGGSYPDEGYVLGPDGILVNDKGEIYIFDVDRNGEGWGLKKYDANGNLLKMTRGGKPIGIDREGNIYLFDGEIYDSGLNKIRVCALPLEVGNFVLAKYVSEDGKLYFYDGPVSTKLDLYKCDPWSDELGEEVHSVFDPRFWNI